MPKRLTTRAQDENLALVKHIKKYPCIYNCTLSDYIRREVVDAAWVKVASATRDTVPNCKEKWRNLRTVFVRKIKHDRKSGSKTPKPYYLTDTMQFIIPFVRVLNPELVRRSTLLSSPSSTADDDEERSDNKPDVSVTVADPPATRSQVRNSGTAQTESAPKQRIRERVSNQELVSDRVDYTTSKKNKQEEHDNARKLFLLSVLPDVEHFTDRQHSIFRRKLLDAIDYAGSFQDYSKCDDILSPASSNLTKSTATSFVYVCDDDSL